VGWVKPTPFQAFLLSPTTQPPTPIVTLGHPIAQHQPQLQLQLQQLHPLMSPPDYRSTRGRPIAGKHSATTATVRPRNDSRQSRSQNDSHEPMCALTGRRDDEKALKRDNLIDSSQRRAKCWEDKTEFLGIPAGLVEKVLVHPAQPSAPVGFLFRNPDGSFRIAEVYEMTKKRTTRNRLVAVDHVIPAEFAANEWAALAGKHPAAETKTHDAAVQHVITHIVQAPGVGCLWRWHRRLSLTFPTAAPPHPPPPPLSALLLLIHDTCGSDKTIAINGT
jgi:hypothetical protein